MPKHLKVRGEIVLPRGEEVKVMVIEQTHQYREFSKQGMSEQGHHSGCFRHGNIILCALTGAFNSVFEKRMARAESYRVILGRDNAFTVPIAHWPAVKAAIQSYNEWGGSQ